MDPREPSQVPSQYARGTARVVGAPRRVRKRHPLSVRDIQIYTACDQLTEGLIYLMVLFSPWAFGTSQPWAVRVMNGAGYVLGGCWRSSWLSVGSRGIIRHGGMRGTAMKAESRK